MFIRTCQECGNVQEHKKTPIEYTNDNWRGLLCRKCKSPALDYGFEVHNDLEGQYENQIDVRNFLDAINKSV